MSGPWVLGIAASHNGAACLLRGDEIVCAVQEERLVRRKHAKIVPLEGCAAVDHVLAAAGITEEAVDRVVVCPLYDEEPASPKHITVSHHRAHAISAYATSGFEDAAVIVMDGMGSPASRLSEGELAAIVGGRRGRETSSIYDVEAGAITALEKQLAETPTRAPDDPRPRMMPWASLGTMFQSVAQQIFGRWFDAGKVMGLAPYGHARFAADAFFTIDGPRFRFCDGVSAAYRHDRRFPEDQDAYQDLACSVQAALEAGVLHLARRARALSKSRNLCLAGGVALNGVANERVIQSGLFDEVFIIAAAEDCGTAIGAAYHGLWTLRGPSRGRRLHHDSHGRRYGRSEMAAALGSSGTSFRETDDPAAAAAALLAHGAVVAWFEGGSEFGPRALGHRSILFDPRRPDAKQLLNETVKHREAFRPFAPAVLCKAAADWFDFGIGPPDSPFMLRVCPVRPARRALIPGVVHVDGTARVQTVPDGPFARVISAFADRTGVPMLLNTSFNVDGEPIVETPEDALRCFTKTSVDALILGHWVVTRER